jgi:ABC-2 type transport system permease protein
MSRLSAVIAVARKEWTDVKRDSTVMKAIFLQPMIITIVFGFAVKSQVRSVAWALYDADRTELSRRLGDEVGASSAVEAPARVGSYAAVDELFRRSAVSAAIVIPRGFARRLERGEASPVQLLLNGADPLVASRFQSSASEFVRRFTAGRNSERRELAPHISSEPEIVLERRMRYNPQVSDEWFFVPTAPAIFLTQLFFGLACFSIVGERERGTYEHLLALPLRPAEILVGKAIPYFAISYVVLAIYFGLAVLLFDVRVRGSFFALAVAAFLFCATSYSIAALFSTIARNVHQAIYLTVFSVLPSTVISGFLVPTSTMPLVIKVAALGLPATHFVTALRAIVVRGASFGEIGEPLGALLAIFAVVFGLVLLLFPRRLV